MRRLGIEFLRVLGWRHGAGVTIGGQPYEELLCPLCAKDEKKKVRTKPDLEQDALPIDWDQYQTVPRTQGGHTR